MNPYRIAVLSAVKRVFGMGRVDRLSQGWRKLAQDPDVISDLCVLGHLHEPDIDPDTGDMLPERELVARAARKALVLQLLARAEVTRAEINSIRNQEDTSYDPDTD